MYFIDSLLSVSLVYTTILFHQTTDNFLHLVTQKPSITIFEEEEVKRQFSSIKRASVIPNDKLISMRSTARTAEQQVQDTKEDIEVATLEAGASKTTTEKDQQSIRESIKEWLGSSKRLAENIIRFNMGLFYPLIYLTIMALFCVEIFPTKNDE